MRKATTTSSGKAKRATRAVGTADRAATKTLRKALGLLEVIATSDHALSVAELASRAGISRPTAHRLVQTLAADGYVEPDPLSGRLSIGLAVLPFAASVLDSNRLRVESLPHLRTLAESTQQRANLGVLHRHQVLYLAGMEKPSLPMIYSRFGNLAPATCSSLGKAIMAFLPSEEVDEIVASHPLVQYTETTITDPARLAAELEATRKRGYSIDMGEHRSHSVCVSAPIFDSYNRPVGAIGISGRTIEPLLAEVQTVRHAAEVISHLISKEER